MSVGYGFTSSRGRRLAELRWTKPDVPEPRGVLRPTLEDMLKCREVSVALVSEFRAFHFSAMDVMNDGWRSG